MSEVRGQVKNRLAWGALLPSTTRKRYEIVSGTPFVIDGIKRFCDAGLTEQAFLIIELLVSKGGTVFPFHIESFPRSCAVLYAGDVVPYEENGFFIVVEYESLKSGQIEHTCFFIDDETPYIRLCTLNELQKSLDTLSRDER